MFKSDRGTGNERFSNLPQRSLKMGRINGPQYRNELSRGGVYVPTYGDGLLDGLRKLGEQETVSAVKFQLREVGIREYMGGGPGVYDEVVKAVRKAGLDLLPQLAAAETALNHADFIGEGEWVDFLSKPIAGRFGYRSVFGLLQFGGRLGLYGYGADHAWSPVSLAVARLR